MLLLNALVDFIPITIFCFVLLLSMTCIALGISFFINIKYEIIELPKYLGGNGFSINFYQDQEKNFSQHIIDNSFTETEIDSSFTEEEEVEAGELNDSFIIG